MNLVSLAKVKSWLNVTTSTDDAFTQSVISQATRFILNYISRPNIARTTFTEVKNGSGTNKIMMRQWPIVSVASISVSGQALASASGTTPGYVVEQVSGGISGRPQMIGISSGLSSYDSASCDYRNSGFPRGQGNVTVVYDAGYAVMDEAYTVSGAAITVTTINGPWAQDDGIKYATGAALVKVASAPAAGQYSVTQDAATLLPTYAFNAADNGRGILVSYSFIPADLEEACMELVGERIRTAPRIGQTSHSSAGGLVVAFSTKNMHDYIRAILDQYSNRTPLPC